MADNQKNEARKEGDRIPHKRSEGNEASVKDGNQESKPESSRNSFRGRGGWWRGRGRGRGGGRGRGRGQPDVGSRNRNEQPKPEHRPSKQTSNDVRSAKTHSSNDKKTPDETNGIKKPKKNKHKNKGRGAGKQTEGTTVDENATASKGFVTVERQKVVDTVNTVTRRDIVSEKTNVVVDEKRDDDRDTVVPENANVVAKSSLTSDSSVSKQKDAAAIEKQGTVVPDKHAQSNGVSVDQHTTENGGSAETKQTEKKKRTKEKKTTDEVRTQQNQQDEHKPQQKQRKENKKKEDLATRRPPVASTSSGRPTSKNSNGPKMNQSKSITSGREQQYLPHTKDGKQKRRSSKEENKRGILFEQTRQRRLSKDRTIPVEVSMYPRFDHGRPLRTQHINHHEMSFAETTTLYVPDPENGIDMFHFAPEEPGKLNKRLTNNAPNLPPESDSNDRVIVTETIKIRHSKTTHNEKSRAPKHNLHHPSGREEPKYVHPDDQHSRNRKQRFSPFLSPEEIQKGIEEGTLYRGILRINKRRRGDSYVTSDDLDRDIYIYGQRDRNRALEGDVVAVRLLDVDKIWSLKKRRDQKRKEQREGANKASPPEIKDETKGENMKPSGAEQENEEQKEDDVADQNKPKYCGEVVGILERAPYQTYAGTLSLEMPVASRNDQKEGNDENVVPEDQENNKSKEIRLVWFKPTDRRTPLIAIPIHLAPSEFITKPDQYKNQLFTAKITKWPIDAQYPFGQILQYLGTVGDMEVETAAILADCNIKNAPFSPQALKHLPPVPWNIPSKEYEVRWDLRENRIFTIDPSTAKDLDDAVHVVPLDDGNFEVGVHIADVSYFIRRFSPLDSEARHRGTSTYMVDKVIPMLPATLCEDLCSLNPGVDRLAFSVIWKMDPVGNVLNTWFGRSIIRSCAKLSYDDAQSVIEGKGLPESAETHGHPREAIEKDILHLFKLSQHMRKRRFESGALSISSIRLSVKLDDSGEPESVYIYELKEANRLIEEFMLRANMSVAEKISRHYPDEALLRRHAPPIERRLEEFLKLADELGYKIDGSSAGGLQSSFDAITSEDVRTVLMVHAIKPMQRAKYFCTGTLDISKYTHYALNVPLYTHFTSPIRRYADVIVHRQLEAALRNKEQCGYDKKTIQKIAVECNRSKDGAKNAQELHTQLYLARYLDRLDKTEGPVIRAAIVTHVVKDAFEVLVPEYGIEKRIPTNSLPLEREEFEPTAISLKLYWKKGAATPIFAEDGEDIDEEEEEEEEQQSEDEDESAEEGRLYVEDEDIDDPVLGKPIAKRPSEDSAKEELDAEKCMQRLKIFSRLHVLLKVNMQRSPPIINVYPVNPFAEMPSKA